LIRGKVDGILRTINDGVEVDICVTQGSAGDGIAADLNGGNGADLVEQLEKTSLCGKEER
jgi:hypothetical protein